MSSIRYLKTFLVVAHEGSFAAAADKVALTQAAVGQQMRALELELKTSLFERAGRGRLLTEAGRAMVAHAGQLVSGYEQMRETLQQGSEGVAGLVTVGSTGSAMGLLSSTVIALKPRYPRLNVRLVLRDSASLGQSVFSGELDAAVFVEDIHLERKGLLWTPLYVEPLTVVASSLVAGPDSDIKKLLRDNPFIRFDRRTPSGIRIDRMLHKLGVAPEDFLELSSLSTLVDLVRQNVGVTIVPHLKTADWKNDPSLQVLALPGRPSTRQIGMLEQARREQVTSVIRLQLIDLLARRG